MKNIKNFELPKAIDKERVGKYPALCGAGAGYFWDLVLEYRLWIHPKSGSDYYYAFGTMEETVSMKECLESEIESGIEEDIHHIEEPLVLILQVEHINEPESGVFEHIRKPRICEWHTKFLSDENHRDDNKILLKLKQSKKVA